MLLVGGVFDAVFCGVDCVSMFVGLWFLLYDFFLFGLGSFMEPFLKSTQWNDFSPVVCFLPFPSIPVVVNRHVLERSLDLRA